MEEKQIEELRKDVQELNKTIKTATNKILECLSLISCKKSFVYEAPDSAHVHDYEDKKE